MVETQFFMILNLFSLSSGGLRISSSRSEVKKIDVFKIVATLLQDIR